MGRGWGGKTILTKNGEVEVEVVVGKGSECDSAPSRGSGCSSPGLPFFGGKH